MKFPGLLVGTLGLFAVLCSSQAYATRSIHVDDPGNGGDCQFKNWQGDTSDPAVTPHDFVVPGLGSSDGAPSICSSPAPFSSPGNDAAAMGAGFLATSAVFYEWGGGPGYYYDNPGNGPTIDAGVYVFKLANGDTEIELDDSGNQAGSPFGPAPALCGSGSGSSGTIQWGATTLTGGCSSTASADFLFDSSGFQGAFNAQGQFESDAAPGWTETTSAAPEPSTLALFGLVLGALISARRVRKTRASIPGSK